MQILIYILTAFFFVKDSTKKGAKSAKSKVGKIGVPDWLIAIGGGLLVWQLYKAYQKAQTANESASVGDGTTTQTNGLPLSTNAADYANRLRAAMDGYGVTEDVCYAVAGEMFRTKTPYAAVADSYRLQFSDSWLQGLSKDLTADLTSELSTDEYAKFFGILRGQIPAGTPAPNTTPVLTPPVVVVPPVILPNTQAKKPFIYAVANVNLRELTAPFKVVAVVPKGGRIGAYFGVGRYKANSITEAGYLVKRQDGKTLIVSSRSAYTQIRYE